MTVLDKVNDPKDIKGLTALELEELATNVRDAILNRVSQYPGGHLGPNLGVVEMTIALHKVFNSPVDKLIWDVSHQSYPHKVLTGRKEFFTDKDKFSGTTGYTDPEENEHDFIRVGHTSTSIATAMGYALARDMQGKKENIVAIIGDGALSGGLAFEGLDGVGTLNGNLIIIVNDNEMAITENHGGIYQHLADLRASKGTSANNLFKSFGLDYRYLEEGNDIQSLIALFESVKDINRPIVLHIHTEKGHGYKPAVENKEGMHQVFAPFDIATGQPVNSSTNIVRSYNNVFLDFMEEKLAKGDNLIAINAAIPMFFGLSQFAKNHPKNYVDGGIAEQYTVTLGGAIAAAGTRAIIFQNATFLQRAYDQLNHDLALNKEPAIVIISNSQIGGTNDTHQGSFVYSQTSNIPNVIDLAATSEEDLFAMLNWAYNQHEHPVFIHLPEHTLENRPTKITDFSKPQYEVVKSGEKVAILGLGAMLEKAENVAEELEKSGFNPTVVNPFFANLLDVAALDKLSETHGLFVTIEDGTKDGGFGQKVATYLASKGIKTLVYGADTEFIDAVPKEELYNRYHIRPELMATDIIEATKESKGPNFFKKIFSK
ncbi:1-deoxy-D-xylulose-5-phosphate synthase [Lactococcus lactis subsp. lactis]|uniref:1-deoxy-D-xylulose-5-phosphate synthase n=1 Tax=Lactococcus lactis TaxID=1358 RepID=UPI00071C76D6|nr:1-deoxy-D-xylulose-5-phosphate synthase [Lactococcus lactis]MDT3325035.1 1-deoxy-D-xylulose-5-phosphate synthase [Bacillota bacterium]KST77483.1 1-deoxy-D-xylulose 5-phosphate synthase [Lactococcus lactis subsp. lactis]MBR8678831.1 1-deoxy-D-xylulose-5-phosphate synthase [Lactococcus lactis subsp. lactis]MBR8680742.1 1-deoxy-D-xylulose-5-phosphate synthase [Lactococcus lactis subsp. lactis]MBR8685867.1 1-deoxy-D-xylulose-5-phosphate synthase [Lactococcus lactis subsp. lactis]